MVSIWRSIARCLSGGRLGERFVVDMVPPIRSGLFMMGEGAQAGNKRACRWRNTTMRIGFVGTGTMGTPIAGCLLHAGHSLSVYDRRPEAAGILRAQGAASVDSAFDAARDSEVVFTSLPGPAEFEAAMLEPHNGILAGLRPGTTHIDLTTNAPNTIARVAAACQSPGVELIDAPVSGRPPNMTVMIGASDAAFARYRPLFETIAVNVFHVGASGAGATA